ncbi:MAG: hypothetical protein AB8F74_20680 [Saprospiraceae bacterium]
MKNQRKNYNSKLKSFDDISVSKKDLENVKGGFLFKMVDDVRCGLERSVSRLFGGNGDGNW